MSKPVYLYRAVLTKPRTFIVQEYVDGDVVECFEVMPAGTVLGRRSGYLSRSGAAQWRADDVEIIRSEPIVFLSRAEQLQKQINELTAELAVERSLDAQEAELDRLRRALLGQSSGSSIRDMTLAIADGAPGAPLGGVA